MQSIRSDMEGGIKMLIEEQAKEPGSCLVTLAQFDTEYESSPAVPAAEVSGTVLSTRRTALLDAIGRTIGEVRDTIEAQPVHRRPQHVVFAVVTDGENSSQNRRATK